MGIRTLKLENFKRFRNLSLDFNNGMNILVGANDAGKSTVLEAIHLAITGLLSGRYLKNELSQYLFNNAAVAEYIMSLKKNQAVPPPQILIEVYLSDGDFPAFEGNDNSMRTPASGFYLKIHFDDAYQREYEQLVKSSQVLSLPIEYYALTWRSFARDPLSSRTVPLKSALIDSSAARYQSGADVYVSRIVRDFLDTADVVGIAQAYRRMKETFSTDTAIASVNAKIQLAAQVSKRPVSLSANLPSRSDWEDGLVACVADVPFCYSGKGEQSVIKTKLAMHHKGARDAAVVLLEEPENHLTHTNLNRLLGDIKVTNPDRQVIVSTHSSFVANKLGLDSLILVNDTSTTRITSLKPETKEFFEKVAGYDTLRLILASKAVLVEGDSDELIVQKAYELRHAGRLPIEDGIDVISVGTSFLRFLEIADLIEKPVAVVTDNDGDPAALQTKYADYLGAGAKPHIKICFDPTVDAGTLSIRGKPFNYNTLEPKILKANGLPAMNKILGTRFATLDEMHVHMRANKTDCALGIFKTQRPVQFPDYIVDAIS